MSQDLDEADDELTELDDDLDLDELEDVDELEDGGPGRRGSRRRADEDVARTVASRGHVRRRHR
jgi:hypothetical protein